MIKNLVIVESPAKAKTIERFLGNDYKVMSSYGHIRDLRKKNFSIDVDHDFDPIYEIPEDKKHVVAELQAAAAKAQTIWLASDEDREGEAIAWHLSNVLGIDPTKAKRIVFHEITKNAILDAIKHPRPIDLNRVDAQQARRVLDRIVGFELSPVLWKKIKPSLSAGRVQSVAVRLIVEREDEIKNFNPESYFRVVATLTTPDGATLRADLNHRLTGADAARDLLNACAGATFTVGDIDVRPLHKSPAPPFTTSTLQQEAARRLGFTVSQTMMIAQRLYEAGHITYMRTDSLNLSSLAIGTIADDIRTHLGDKYLKTRNYHTATKGAQEAHEAIRPTYIDRETIDGTAQEKRLYALIRRRTIASQMADAQIEKTTATITVTPQNPVGSPITPDMHFTATGEVITFDGFLHLYNTTADDDSDPDTTLLPALTPGETLTVDTIIANQRYTQQPTRYTEAALVKKLEELGIGRPSTYAPTISTIQQREYVVKGEKAGASRRLQTLTLKDGKISSSSHNETYGAEKNKLLPTDTGVIVNKFLTQYFPDILDYNFTADIEQKFDQIADGNLDWHKQIASFYDNFHPQVDAASNMRLEHKVGERILGTDPVSGHEVTVKIGRYGPVVQIGTADPDNPDNKPRFAPLQKGQSIETLTLEQALKLFQFPRQLGEFEGKNVTVGIGRFGPYLHHDGKYVSIPKTMQPTALTLDDAITLIEQKRADDLSKIIATFPDDPDMQILNGRYGVYIAYKGNNYRMPKTVQDPKTLTHDQVLDIINNQETKPRRTTRRATASRKKS